MNETKAKQLVDRYFEGTTTLRDEQELYAYFTSGHVSAELKPLRQMFLDMCQLQGCEPAPKATVVGLKSRSWRRVAIAATVAATAGIVAGVWFGHTDSTSYEMIAYGKHMNDRKAVMSEVNRTLGDTQSSAPNIGDELKDAFAQY